MWVKDHCVHQYCFKIIHDSHLIFLHYVHRSIRRFLYDHLYAVLLSQNCWARLVTWPRRWSRGRWRWMPFLMANQLTCKGHVYCNVNTCCCDPVSFQCERFNVKDKKVVGTCRDLYSWEVKHIRLNFQKCYGEFHRKLYAYCLFVVVVFLFLFLKLYVIDSV